MTKKDLMDLLSECDDDSLVFCDVGPDEHYSVKDVVIVHDSVWLRLGS